MRFAITASDRYLGVWESFIARGWVPVKLFTTPVDHRLHHNKAVIKYARQLGIEAQISPMTADDLQDLAEQGCEALVVASYSWRIGDWRPHLKYAVNFHPSPLPLGRGPYPAVPAILENSPSWGVTCHQLEATMDTGPILASRHFPLSPQECHESLDLRLQMAARDLAGEVADHFIDYWNGATPQMNASYFPHWTQEDRTLDFTQTVEAIMRRVRAFGMIECQATVNDVTIHVHRAVGWTESHAFRPGAMVHTSAMQMVVAARDGFIGIVEWSLLSPDAPVGNIHR